MEKIDNLKFLACPVSTVTVETWELLRLVNLCTNREGDILHLPELEYSIVDQSPRFLAAVETVRSERNSEWFRRLQEERAKRESDG